MKILKYLFIGVAVLLLIFFAVGFIHPKVHYSHEIQVNKALKEAWAVTQDDSKFHLWLEGFESIELIEGEKNAIGSKYRVVVNPGEEQDAFEMIETVTSLQEFDHVTLDFDSDFGDFVQTISFAETNDGTSIKTENDVIAEGLFTKSMFALMEMLGSTFTKQEAKNINALKKVIEENTTDYYPEPVLIEEEEEEVAE